MTKQEVLDDIKALYKELYDKLKQGKISKAEYTSLYDQLNDAMYQLNMGKISAAEVSFSLNPVMMALQKADSAAPASGNQTAGMTQDEYDKQKKAMYQKYKAGEITNYAYIQWKKKNNPAGKVSGGAVSAPAAGKAQTPATQPQAAKTAAVSGMTQAEFDAKKKEMYKKYKNGEITNYAYIQWKKANDPSKQAQNVAVTAPKAKSSTSTGAAAPAVKTSAAGSAGANKKATITAEQLKELKKQLMQKYIDGEINQDLFDDIGWELDSEAKSGKSLKEVEEIMHASVLNNYINEIAVEGTIEYEETDTLNDLVEKMLAAGYDEYDIKGKIDQIVEQSDDNGQPVKDAMAEIGINPDNIPPKGKDGTFLQAQMATGIDPGTLAAEKAVDDLTDELKGVYGQAAKELKEEFDKFTDAFQAKMAQKQQDLQSGKITQAEYDAWVQNQLKTSELFQAKVDQMTDTLLHANQKAVAMINGETLGVFAENANFQAYQITQDAKVNLSFAIYDENTARKLIQDKPELLPRKVVNGQKDKAWNQKQIAGAVAQAVLQGESIPKLAKRIAQETASTNMKAMVRYARTAMTGAQNAGRMEMLHQAKGMGIKVKKRWLATLDSRTRDNHRKLDGQIKDIDEPFEGEYGKIMFPGDPEGHPGDVYNCRCTLVYEYEGYPNDPADNQRLYYEEWDDVWYTTEKDKNGKKYQKEHVNHHRESHLITDMNYDEWKAAKEGSKLNDLNVAKVTLAEAQKAVLKAKISETKQYKDIWKDPVTLADYEAKKGSIQAKRDYYEAEIQKQKDAIANGYSWGSDDKLKDLQKKLKLLNEFETNGKLLADRDKALMDVQDIYNAVGFQKTAGVPDLVMAKQKPKKKTTGTAQAAPTMSLGTAGAQKTQFAPDAWDAKTKKAAKFFNKRTETDKVLRPDLDQTWKTLTDEEKFATWMYTLNSHPINQPLSGYNDGWKRSNYVGGPSRTNWGHQDNYSNRNLSGFRWMSKFADARGQPSFKKIITNLTKAIEKSTMKNDIWFKRQSDNSGLAGMMEATGFSYDKIMQLLNGNPSQDELDRAFVGQRGKMNSFTSCGMAKDANWFGNVYYKIYVPKGTKALYSEPQSHYGNSMGGQDKIYQSGSSYRGIGTEAEVILQRGTTYRITKITRSGSDYNVEMEVVEQPDYFAYGDEDTYNEGKTRHKK